MTHFKIKRNSLLTTKYEVSVNNFEDDFKAAKTHSPGPNYYLSFASIFLKLRSDIDLCDLPK
jgi:hypothetical protein